jgi:hypothetical protein
MGLAASKVAVTEVLVVVSDKGWTAFRVNGTELRTHWYQRGLRA